MNNKKYYNQEIAYFVRDMIKDKLYDKSFKKLICEIIMRKAYEYHMPLDLVKDEVKNIVMNVRVIKFIRDNDKSLMGFYCEKEQTIAINENVIIDYFKRGYSLEEVCAIFFSTFAHELQHAALNKKDGSHGLKIYRESVILDEVALDEIAVEGIADSITYKKNGLTNGYKDITPMLDVISATFGITTNMFLEYCNKGREGINQLLNIISHNNPDEFKQNLDTLKHLEQELNILYNQLYSQSLKKLLPEEERKDAISSTIYFIGFTSLYSLEHRIENIKKNSKGNNDTTIIKDIKRLINSLNTMAELIEGKDGPNLSWKLKSEELQREFKNQFERMIESEDLSRDTSEEATTREWDNQEVNEIIQGLIISRLRENRKIKIQLIQRDELTFVEVSKYNLMDKIKQFITLFKNRNQKRLVGESEFGDKKNINNRLDYIKVKKSDLISETQRPENIDPVKQIQESDRDYR